MPVVGFLASSSADMPSGPVAAVHLGLKQGGYELGQTVRMEYRYANNQLERLPALAAELVRIPAAVIVTSGGPRPTLVAKASTTTIPIVFAPVPERPGHELQPARRQHHRGRRPHHRARSEATGAVA